MTHSFDLYWSFRSPYSYLVTPRIVALTQKYDVDVRVRPVYPIAVRMDNFFKKINPLWVPYLLMDTGRLAESLGLPYGMANPDPVVMDLSKGEVPKDQPYIHRLTRLGVAAAEQGHGLAFLARVSHIIWSGTVQGWNTGDHLARAAKSAGLNLAELDEKIEKNPQHYEDIIVENETAQKEAGHWGVPLMVYKGEPFFGQDRLDILVWRMKKDGLTARG